MGRKMSGIFLMILCSVMACSGGRSQEIKGKNGNYYLYIDDGRSMEISYISYNVIIRENGNKGEGREEITIVRVVRK